MCLNRDRHFGHLASIKLRCCAFDTSPRGAGIEGEDDTWDFGTGAGMYVDATVEPWSNNYSMYSYVTKEIFEVVFKKWPVISRSRMGVFGHSMGGGGTIMAPPQSKPFQERKCFAPICNPSESALTSKILSSYLGPDKSTWADYDSTTLLRKTWARRCKIRYYSH